MWNLYILWRTYLEKVEQLEQVDTNIILVAE